LGEPHKQIYYNLKDQRFLGEDGFVEEVRKAVHEDFPSVYTLSVQEIIIQVTEVFKIPQDLMYGPSRGRQGALGRALVAFLGRKLGGYKIKTIADHFRRDPVVISQAVQRLEQKIRQGEIASARIRKIEGAIIKKKNPKYLFTYA
jgi:chromosomal replication initiation ATPase DnaA